MQPQVLIVGAGPTGLVLALWLAKSGVRFRIVEKNDGPGHASRAMVVQARTLEFYRQLDLAQKVIDAGIHMDRAHLREGNKEVATFDFTDFGKGLSPYPFALSYPQDDHERFLVHELKQLGVEVEWNAEIVGVSQSADQVHAVLKKASTTEHCDAEYLCGCDGAHSTVRESLGFGFPGGTYEQLFFVADLEAIGAVANPDVNLCIGNEFFYATFPVRRPGMCRLIGIIPPELADHEGITYEDIRKSVEDRIDLHVTHVNWFSKYRVHHRVTDRFQAKRVFIAGDAAHIHSPTGGQGMNTGIGDSVNLAWKLAAVVQGRASPAILDTYEPERIGFANSLVHTTDRVFKGIVGTGMGAQVFRTLLLPHIVPFLMGFSTVRRAEFRAVSQTRIHYPDSPLSAGHAGDIHGGDRLPWVEDLNNFGPLRTRDWQIHVYGQPAEEARQLAQQNDLPLHVFPWTDACGHAGFKRDALYLIRPDGHVAVAAKPRYASQIAALLDQWRIAPHPVRA